MDITVIILVAIGIACAAIGLILARPGGKAKGTPELDEDYAENFTNSFESTESIEETLDELLQIYSDDFKMRKLIGSALSYIREEMGDYETALDSININGDPEVYEAHDAAFEKEFGNRPDSHTIIQPPKDTPKEKQKKKQKAEKEGPKKGKSKPKKQEPDSGKKKKADGDGKRAHEPKPEGKKEESRPEKKAINELPLFDFDLDDDEDFEDLYADEDLRI